MSGGIRTPGVERMNAAPAFGSDEELDRSLRPQRLEDFVGQRALKEQVPVAYSGLRLQVGDREQMQRGDKLKRDGAKKLEVTPCGYEHFALVAAYGARIDARRKLHGVEIFQAVAVQHVSLLLRQILVERRLICDQRALVQLDGNSPEKREVIFHLAVVLRVGRAAFKMHWVNGRHI